MPKERIISAIDIGSSKVATVIAAVDEEEKISVIGVSSVPSQGIKKGNVVDIDEAVSSIAHSLEGAERMAGCAVSRAYISVGGAHISSLNSHGVVAVSHQNVEIDESDVARVIEAAQAVAIPSSREILHVIARDYSVDGQEGIRDPVGMTGVRLEVETNIISGATTAIRNLTKCVEQVGVGVEDLVFGGLASSESVLTETEKELGAVLIDIGSGTTDIVLFVNGSSAYSAVLPIGGQNVTNDLAIGLRTSLENAEKIKLKLSKERPIVKPKLNQGEEELVKKTSLAKATEGKEEILDIRDLGLEELSVSKKLLNDVIKARLTEIFTLIAVEIKKSGFGGQLPAGLVICGGAAETANLISVAKTILKMQARIGYPQGATGLIEEISGPAYAGSIGLVLHASRQGEERERFGLGVMRGGVKDIAGKGIGWLKSLLP